MKKTYLKSMLRSIKSSFSRFAAIFAITALGVGFLAGLMSTTPDMRRTIDHYYDSHDMMDIYLKSTYGFNDDDIAAVRNTAGVADAMPHYVTDVMVKSADDSMVARIYGYDYDRLNIGKLTLIDGRYPEKADEVLCEEGNGITASLEIGDKVTITGDAGDTLSDTYSETELTVVGIVMNPYYMSAEREGSTKGNGRVGVLSTARRSFICRSAFIPTSTSPRRARRSLTPIPISMMS
ncbi:MAG: ABC transporter permease [Eubacteriales bacterium]